MILSFYKEIYAGIPLKAFEQIATALKGYTEKCVISFVDVYAKNKKIWNCLIHMRLIKMSC